MARATIKQRISLEGGKEIQDQLRGLGEAGERAFKDISDAARKADLARFGKELGRLKDDLATFGRRVALGFAAVATGAAAASAAVFSLAKSGAEAADEMGKLAQVAGLSIERFGQLSFAAQQSGVSQEEFIAGFSRFNRVISEAAEGNKSAAEAFKALGINVRDAAGRIRPAEAIIDDVVKAFARMPDGVRKSALAMELFGRSGAKLVPFFNLGAEGLRELSEQFESLGLGFTQEQFKNAERFNDTLDVLGRTVRGVRNQIGLLFTPALTRGAQAIIDAIGRQREAILAFADELVSRAVPLVEDFIAALSGRDQDVRNVWILEWRDAAIQFGRDLQGVTTGVVIPAFNSIRTAAQLVADTIRNVFGIDVTAGEILISAALLKLTGGFRVLGSAARLAWAGLKLFKSGPIVGIITAIVGAFGFLFTRYENGAMAARSHEEALRELELAMQAVKAGVPGAADAFDELSKKHLEAAAAAEENARAQLEAARAALEAERLAQQTSLTGPLEARLGLDIPPLEREVEQALQRLDQAAQRRQEIENKITGATQSSLDSVKQTAQEVQTATQQAVPQVEQLATATERIVTVMRGHGDVSSFNVAQQLGQSALDAKASVDQLGDAVDGTAKKASDSFGVVRTVPEAMRTVAEETKAVFDGLGADAEVAGNQIGDGLTGAAQVAQDSFSSVRENIAGQFSSLEISVSGVISRLEAALRRLQAAISAARAQAASAQANDDQGFAGGGFVRGGGTSTSDSIPAWLSNGEFVINARSVRRYGVAFMRALNGMRLPKDAFKGFSMGGLVDGVSRSMAMPVPVPLRMAEGGLVQPKGGRPVNLTIDGQTFNMIAPQDVADKLVRFASGKNLRSAGNKPSWVGA